MQRVPVSDQREPAYPSRNLSAEARRSQKRLKSLAKALGLSAALLFPACGTDLGCSPRLGGDVEPVRLSGAVAIPDPDVSSSTGDEENKPPEVTPPVLPDDRPVRLGGVEPQTRPQQPNQEKR